MQYDTLYLYFFRLRPHTVAPTDDLFGIYCRTAHATAVYGERLAISATMKLVRHAAENQEARQMGQDCATSPPTMSSVDVKTCLLFHCRTNQASLSRMVGPLGCQLRHKRGSPQH